MPFQISPLNHVVLVDADLVNPNVSVSVGQPELLQGVVEARGQADRPAIAVKLVCPHRIAPDIREGLVRRAIQVVRVDVDYAAAEGVRVEAGARRLRIRMEWSFGKASN